MLKISQYDQNLLYKQSQLKKLQDNSYLQDVNDENFKYIREKFFYNEIDKEEKTKLMNIGSGLFTSVTSTIKNYVGEPSTDIEFDISRYVSDYVGLGFATMGVITVDGQIQVEYQPAQNYYNDNGVDKILRLYIKDEDYNTTIYMLVSEYGIGYIKNTLYELNGTDYKSDKEVPLTTIPQTENMVSYIDTGLSINSLFVIGDGKISLIETIKNLVYGVDRQAVMHHSEFLKNVESFILFKDINRQPNLIKSYNEGSKIDFSQIGKVIDGNSESSIEFINNVNTLIDISIEDSKDSIRRVSAMTDIPVDFLGLESKDGAIGEGSRTLKQGSFVKRIKSIRDIFNKTIDIILELGGYEKSYTRPDIIAKSDNALVEELKIAREIRVISHLNAIKKYNDYDDKTAEDELNAIENEALETNQTTNGQSQGDTNTEA